MLGPGGFGPGGPGHGGMMHGGMRYGRPPHGPHPMMRRPRHRSYLGTGLSALAGAAIGTKIANGISNKKSPNSNNQRNYNNSNYYEVFAYCPSCGTKSNGNDTICSNCGASLVKW